MEEPKPPTTLDLALQDPLVTALCNAVRALLPVHLVPAAEETTEAPATTDAAA
jgi:hypothetical protein